MMDEEDRLYWRLSDYLSVEDASVLIAGGNPSDENDRPDSYVAGPLQMRGKATRTALCSAIRAGILPATLCYNVNPNDYSILLPPELGEGKSVSESLTAGPVKLSVLANASDCDDYVVTAEPDWARTTVKVEDLKKWLQSKGISDGFFFPSASPEPLEVLNENHDHFSPELTMAVKAWLALSKTQSFTSSPKIALTNWLRDNEKVEWKGSGKISAAAFERMATVANWRPVGGAPPTRGSSGQ